MNINRPVSFLSAALFKLKNLHFANPVLPEATKMIFLIQPSLFMLAEEISIPPLASRNIFHRRAELFSFLWGETFYKTAMKRIFMKENHKKWNKIILIVPTSDPYFVAARNTEKHCAQWHSKRSCSLQLKLLFSVPAHPPDYLVSSLRHPETQCSRCVCAMPRQLCNK